MVHDYHDSHYTERIYHTLGSNGKLKTKSEPGSLGLMGYELEVGTDCSRHSRRWLSDRVDEIMGDLATCEEDGSLGSVNGFEIITQPATLAAHLSPEFHLDELLAKLDSEGAMSHDTSCCGLHVHYNRGALGHTEQARDMVCAKLLVLMDRFENELKLIARRDYTQNGYCLKFRNFSATGENSTQKLLEKYQPCKDSRDRYHALNLTNRNTIEFRIFRGTLKPLALKATLELVDTMVNYCKTHTTPQIQTCTWLDIISACKYPELAQYWCERSGGKCAA